MGKRTMMNREEWKKKRKKQIGRKERESEKEKSKNRKKIEQTYKQKYGKNKAYISFNVFALLLMRMALFWNMLIVEKDGGDLLVRTGEE
jgi:high-affinity Fe2+/Pb2+ permease